MKRLLRWAGSALGLSGACFVVYRVACESGRAELTTLHGSTWIAAGALATFYAASGILLALAWWQLLAFAGQRTSGAWAIRAYGLSQVAKYLPGNVFHLAGRQALGMAAGLSAAALAKSVLWEFAALAAAGALFTPLALPLFWPFPPVGSWAVWAGLVVVSIAGARAGLGTPVALALGLDALFLAIAGAIFAAVLFLLGDPAIATLPDAVTPCAAYVIAWLVGLITPGAPAGAGVREVVLLFLLRGVVADERLLSAVVLSRIITIVGDTTFFGWAALQGQLRKGPLADPS